MVLNERVEVANPAVMWQSWYSSESNGSSETYSTSSLPLMSRVIPAEPRTFFIPGLTNERSISTLNLVWLLASNERDRRSRSVDNSGQRTRPGATVSWFPSSGRSPRQEWAERARSPPVLPEYIIPGLERNRSISVPSFVDRRVVDETARRYQSLESVVVQRGPVVIIRYPIEWFGLSWDDLGWRGYGSDYDYDDNPDDVHLYFDNDDAGNDWHGMGPGDGAAPAA